MLETAKQYVYHRGQRGIFCEIYFPRRVMAQGTIFTALEKGYDEDKVKNYLQDNARNLRQELEDYWQIFDPYQYANGVKTPAELSEQDVLKRINMYQSPFFGWSDYVVNGAFFDKNHTLVEEATQVIRLMFRLMSQYASEASEAQCQDVLRAMLFWIINRQALIEERNVWDKSEQKRFLAQHEPWPKFKKNFVAKYFVPVAKEAAKWIDDCRLFVFGYLVHNFSAIVLERNIPEEEIWVTSFFNLTVHALTQHNAMKGVSNEPSV